MTKTFCDVCENKLIREEESGEIHSHYSKGKIVLHYSTTLGGRNTDVCWNCLVEIFRASIKAHIPQNRKSEDGDGIKGFSNGETFEMEI